MPARRIISSAEPTKHASNTDRGDTPRLITASAASLAAGDDAIERPHAVRHVDRLVADVAEVARGVSPEQLDDFLARRRARHTRNRGVGRALVPALHRIDERLTRLLSRRHTRFRDRPHRPIALTHVCRLRPLELIERPEDRQPPIALRRREARQMRGVHHEHRMELEPDRTRLNRAHARQQQRREHFAVAHAAANAHPDLFEQPLARRLFQQTHERFAIGMQSDDARIERRLVVTDCRQSREEREIAEAHEIAESRKCAARRRQREKPSSSHGQSPVGSRAIRTESAPVDGEPQASGHQRSGKPTSGH
jgi:hypothetical protein